jgi:hypothetical protein
LPGLILLTAVDGGRICRGAKTQYQSRRLNRLKLALKARQSIAAEGAAISNCSAGIRRRHCFPTRPRQQHRPCQASVRVVASDFRNRCFRLCFRVGYREHSASMSEHKDRLLAQGREAMRLPSRPVGQGRVLREISTMPRPRLFANASCPSFVFSIDSHDATTARYSLRVP